ncbi:fatty acyl-AMP ligase [Mycolicibacterium sp. BiH015]|uniref:fatty acyl-AMP ligase n=1 Tax=Mycolicibacterium sp. BiH015 TaxID=3018808 RepID=UPI0022E20833|nr:fatty acyl-AMP ligase [Mycolicibacterium sp. BiH015]MDA2890610.1 fatty acyl-AMP ligase [Mycolicibacterium sp. BiH015]
MAHHPRAIVDVLSARSASPDLAYVFLVDGTVASAQRWSFADTAAHAATYAAALSARGVGRGSRVVLAVNPGLDYIAALFGILSLGAVAVPCFPPLRLKEVDRFHAILVDCEPQAVVIDAMYRSAIDALRDSLAGSQIHPEVCYIGGLSADAKRAAPAECALGDLALIQYTSGSTGTPKGVCITHDNLVSNCQALDRSMGLDLNRVGFSWLPPYHDMGLIGTIILSLYYGWPLVLMSPMHFVQDPSRWLQAINDYRVTITVGPNFSLDLAAMALDGMSEGPDLSTLREVYCGAEPISAATIARFEAAAAPFGFDGAALIPCYGMAEATLFVCGKPKGFRYKVFNDVVSCGVVDSEHTVRIVDPVSRHPVADGDVGEIWVSGRSVAAGYYRRDELTAEVFGNRLPGDPNTYLRTGDLGFYCGGELFVTGRIKDLIIVNGRNIYPQDVEASVVRTDPALRSAVAFSVPGDASERLIVLAEAVLANGRADHGASLTDAIRSSVTSEFGIGPEVHICPKRTIPTTTSGKIRRQEAKRLFLADAIQGATL